MTDSLSLARAPTHSTTQPHTQAAACLPNPSQLPTYLPSHVKPTNLSNKSSINPPFFRPPPNQNQSNPNPPAKRKILTIFSSEETPLRIHNFCPLSSFYGSVSSSSTPHQQTSRAPRTPPTYPLTPPLDPFFSSFLCLLLCLHFYSVLSCCLGARCMAGYDYTHRRRMDRAVSLRSGLSTGTWVTEHMEVAFLPCCIWKRLRYGIFCELQRVGLGDDW